MNELGQCGYQGRGGAEAQRVMKSDGTPLSGVVSVSAGLEHACARTSAGTVYCWGMNDVGQLGNGTTGGFRADAAEVLGLSSVADVALGYSHSCARKNDGTLWCWGNNGGGQLGDGTTTSTSTPVQAGANTLGSNVAEVALGSLHTCARKTDGTLWCWGFNRHGQLGNGTNTPPHVDVPNPTPVQAGASTLGNAVAKIALGGGHSCAHKVDGTLWCWGWNSDGQLGNGTTTDQNSPVQAGASTLGNLVAEVSLGGTHSCARKTDGTLWCWGWNANGSVGNGTTTNESTPVQSGPSTLGSDVAEVSLGNDHSCARKTDGTLWCWGSNWQGQLGYGYGEATELCGGETPCVRAPILVMGLRCDGNDGICGVNENYTISPADCRTPPSCGDGKCEVGETPETCPSDCLTVIAIAAGTGHTCALKLDGSVWCWGKNDKGQLGDGTTSPKKLAPVQAGASVLGHEVVAIAVGVAHSCARKTDGTLWCWGKNDKGQLGDGTLDDHAAPVQAGTSRLGSHVTEVALGAEHSCARKTDGTLWCWGANGSGQLGDGSLGDHTKPVQAGADVLGSDVAEVALGAFHGCARKTDGTLWCWGDNNEGQLGDGSVLNQLVPIRIGASTLGSNVAHVALGHNHSCALKTDGTLWCWGFNNKGQVGDGSMVTRTTPVRAGANTLGSNVAEVALGGGVDPNFMNDISGHTCARKTDGTLWCWGEGDWGQLGSGTYDDQSTPVQAGANTLGNGVVQIDLGAHHTCVRKADGILLCWGINQEGQVAGVGWAFPFPVPVPWCGDRTCSMEERDAGNCTEDCTPTLGDGICDPFLNKHLVPNLPGWEGDTDCCSHNGSCAVGQRCAQPSDCASGFCVDGVCCDAACNGGACDACSVAAGASSDGTCALLTGTSCSDGNACTQVDTCQSGVCVSEATVTCTASDECHEAGTCDPATGCSNPVKPDGSPCAGGVCVDGVCNQGGGGGAGDGDGCSVAPTGDSSSTAPAWLTLGLLLAWRKHCQAVRRNRSLVLR